MYLLFICLSEILSGSHLLEMSSIKSYINYWTAAKRMQSLAVSVSIERCGELHSAGLTNGLATSVYCIAQWKSPLHRGSDRKNICCQKIFGNSFSFKATEMVLTSKWGRIQPEIQI